MLFEWDENKNAKNVKKHGVDFNIAALVFDDENRLELFDAHNSVDEERFLTIGFVEVVTALVCVCYTIRGARTRIISARLATKREENIYYGCKRY